LDLPPKTTTIPFALPLMHKLAEWYTLARGASDLDSSLTQVKGLFSTFKHPNRNDKSFVHDLQQSFTGSCPVLPPKTIKNGLVKVRV
jgi:hypothetical protein